MASRNRSLNLITMVAAIGHVLPLVAALHRLVTDWRRGSSRLPTYPPMVERSQLWYRIADAYAEIGSDSFTSAMLLAQRDRATALRLQAQTEEL